MKLCMFSPKGRDLERGWPGRIEDDRVVCDLRTVDPADDARVASALR